MSYGWKFPVNNDGGQKEGLNNHTMEAFKDDKYNHLPREIIQNSLDAQRDNSEKVTVSFTKHIVDMRNLPDSESLKRIFSNLIESETDDKYIHFYKNAFETLAKDKLKILKISDFGTTGLVGVEDSSGSWDSLIFNSGSSYKPEGSMGSYGLGKNAPFLVSNLYTILYATKVSDNRLGKGLIGVSKLATHTNDDGELTRGVGYYRDLNDYNNPYRGDTILPELTRRDELGTDILVLGFTDEENWVEQTVISVLNNFFIKILEDGLEVIVDNVTINKKTINKLMIEYQDHKKLEVFDYFECYTNKSENCHRKKIKIRDLGEIELTIFLDGSTNRKVLMTRDKGMKIKYLTNFSRMVYFTGIGIVRGKKLNEILLKSEPPAHNDWKAGYYRGEMTEKEVDDLLAEMRTKVREYVDSFEEDTSAETVDIVGLENLLGYKNPKNKDHMLMEDNAGYNKVAQIKINTKKGKQKIKKIYDSDGNQLKKHKIIKQKRKNQKKVNNPKTKKNLKPITAKASIENIRIIGSKEKNDYTIFFTPKTSGSLQLLIKQIGLNGKKYTRMLDEIKYKDNIIAINKGITDPFEVTQDEDIELKVKLKSSRLSKLEVTTYEH